MLRAIVEITCDVCGKKFELENPSGAELVVEHGLEPAWTGWPHVEVARLEDWMIDLTAKTVFCDEHGPEDVTHEQ